MDAPTLAAITLDRTGGGIAAVSELLWHVFQRQWGSNARVVTMFDGENHPASLHEKARFTLSLIGREALGRTDWILFSHLALAGVQRALPARLRQPYGVFLHGIEAWKPLSSGQERALANADVRFANSKFTATRVMETHPGIGPVDVCPLALPPVNGTAGAGGEAADAFAVGPHAVLVVGRMSSSEGYKGHDQLIDAWPQVIAKVPDARLVVAGDGDDAQRLKRKAGALSVGGTILFTGFVPKPALDALYRQASLFALPSRGEGFGLVYLEAMAHRLACVGSVHDAAREIIMDGRTGRLVEQANIDELADTISTLLLDEEQRRTMGEAGYSRLLSEFSFDAFHARLCRLLRIGQPVPAVLAPGHV